MADTTQQIDLGCCLLQSINAKIINRQHCERHRIFLTEESFKVDEKEKLFAKFFNDEKTFVKDLSDLDLMAHIEGLGKIAFEARAKLTAANDEKETRKSGRKSKGFVANVQTDDITSEAMATVRKRGEKLSKHEKLIEGMMKLPGMDRATAEKLASASTVKAHLDAKFGPRPEEDEKEIQRLTSSEAAKPFVNPFLPKAETTTVSIQEDNTIVIHTEVTEKPAFVNPFLKKS